MRRLPGTFTSTFIVVLAMMLLVSGRLHAMSFFVNEWEQVYPDSQSGAIANCQLCHEQAGGDDGWNSYGWAIRDVIDGFGVGVSEAIDIVRFDDSDQDPLSIDNETEIEFSQQPGWKEGNSNTIYYANGTTLTNQPQPDFDTPGKLYDPIPAGISAGLSVSLETLATGLVAPNLAIAAPGLSNDLFVVDQIGQIIQVSLADASKRKFFDIGALGTRELIPLSAAYDERGLLGLAFHPDFSSNGKFYTYHSVSDAGISADFSIADHGNQAPDHQSVIVEWQVNVPGVLQPTVDYGSRREILRIDQPQFNHNGGMLSFGASISDSKYLYISLGDGGSADDGPDYGHSPGGNGQDTNNPLGTILRIIPDLAEVGTLSANGQYRIPFSNNPGSVFGLDEIYAAGLRNVHRFSFDTLSGNLYAGDVGQNDIEEINEITNGANYGWPAKEGSFYFVHNDTGPGYVSSDPPAVPVTGVQDPLLQYDHDEGISVIGGYVYRGMDIAEIAGDYVFGEFLTQLYYSDDNFQSIKRLGVTGQVPLDNFVLGLGEDSNKELYLLDKKFDFAGGNNISINSTNGAVRRIVPSLRPVDLISGEITLEPGLMAPPGGITFTVRVFDTSGNSSPQVMDVTINGGASPTAAAYQFAVEQDANATWKVLYECKTPGDFGNCNSYIKLGVYDSNAQDTTAFALEDAEELPGAADHTGINMTVYGAPDSEVCFPVPSQNGSVAIICL